MFVLLGVVISYKGAFGQGFQTDFGKSVVQFKDFYWTYYQSPNFDVYFYEGGKEPARFVLENAEKYQKEIEKKFDYPIGEKFNFIVFNSYNDFRQNNNRLNDEQYNLGGKTPILQNKVFIYFNGDHFDFVHQIKAAITKVMLTEMFQGGSLQERIQNNVLLNLPEWYTEGLIRYIAYGWDAYNENEVISMIEKGQTNKFKRLTDDQKVLVSQALWKYLHEKHGDNIIPTLVYNTRLTKSIENSYSYVLSTTFPDVYKEWLESYYKKIRNAKGEEVDKSEEEIKLKRIKRKGNISRWDINNMGNYIAIVTHDRGLSRVWLIDTKKNKRKCIYREGYRRKGEVFDENYPLVGFNPTNNQLTIFYERKSNLYYINYDPNTKKRTEKQIVTGVQTILDFDYHSNGRQIVVSAVKTGQTDLFAFDFKSQFFKPLINDIYNDLHPKYINNSRGIVFASNRTDKILRNTNTNSDYKFSGKYNIYSIPDIARNPKAVTRYSKNSRYNALYPSSYDSNFISYLTQENGFLNLDAAYSDSLFSHHKIIVNYKDALFKTPDTVIIKSKSLESFRIPDQILSNEDVYRIDTFTIYQDSIYRYSVTNYKKHLISYKFFPRYRFQYELFLEKGRYKFYRKSMPDKIREFTKLRETNIPVNINDKPEDIEVLHPDTAWANLLKPGEQDTSTNPILPQKPEIDYFQTDFPNYSTKKQAQIESELSAKKNPKAGLFKKNEKAPPKFASESIYQLRFTPDQMITQVDNGLSNTAYQPYKAGDNSFFNNSLNGFFKLGISDLLKDYRFTGGVKIQTTLRGAEYFLTYEDLKSRWDKRFMLYRRGETKTDDGELFYKQTSVEGRYDVKFPFSEINCIRGGTFLRSDRNIYLTGTRASLEKPDEYRLWTGLKAEWVIDNSILNFINHRTGTRMKVYGEWFNALNIKKTTLFTLGADARHYTPLGKYMVLANRFSFANSFGVAKIAYFLGGTDGWIIPNYNNENQVDPEQNYVYKMQATHMRGFQQNVRNGNSFMVFNNEIRIPFFKMIYNRPLKSTFFDNFQVNLFGDMGSAWNGLLPTGENNAFNKRIIYNNPLTINVITLRDPFVYGFGYGFRSTVLGYYIRLDYAYGREESTWRDRIVYLSIGTDF